MTQAPEATDSIAYYWLHEAKMGYGLPALDQALTEPNGLLAAGGDLEPDSLISAYRQGVFPWYSRGQPILWWSPDPRTVLFPDALKISRSLAKRIRRGEYKVTFDTAFNKVIASCAGPRLGIEEIDDQRTWITPEMVTAYCNLHQLGVAHSVEAWFEDELVGGLYGVGIGRVFFGESMFHRRSDASKVALAALVCKIQALGTELIDCQVGSQHLKSLGAVDLSRDQFAGLLKSLVNKPLADGDWG